MKKIWISIAMLSCLAFAESIFNADGSINTESAEYQKANVECNNGCDYEDWSVSDSLSYSLDGKTFCRGHEINGIQPSESHPLYIKFSTTIKTDHWFETTQSSIPIAIKVNAENGFKYYMVSQGNGDFSWIKNEREGIYKFRALANKKGIENVSILKLSSIKSGTVSFQIIYLNKSLNSRYGNKYSIYVHPKK